MRIPLLLLLACTPLLHAQQPRFSAAPADSRISRVVFSTAQLGNLLFPKDPRTVQIAVEARRTLLESARTVTCEVRDYFGAEQTDAIQFKLAETGNKPGLVTYTGTLDLASATLEIGRYYEVHLAVPGETGAEPFRARTSFAILPEAETKKHKPEEVPFTSRSPDNRLAEHIRLTDRLGIRICGIAGGWSAKAPYSAQAPQLDLAKQLGMGWLTNTPAAQIEAGSVEYTGDALRQGARSLITQFGGVRPMAISLGREPQGAGERVLLNVAVYRMLYEAVKKADPKIPVLATSVEPNEEYFKAGYGQWCDVFDFHLHEAHGGIRRTLGDYRALMKKYNCEKPVCSTELGLNPANHTRAEVASGLIKNFTTFFAAGGISVSWTGLLTPDTDGKLASRAAESPNVFDERSNRYAPRLDAIAYYNAVNAIAIKKFVEEKEYPNGVRAFLFRDRDQRTLQVLWSDQRRQEIGVPLAGVNEVQVIRVDGSRRTLQADSTDLTLSVGDEPLLLLYQGGGALAPQLAAPAATLEPLPKTLSRKEASPLAVATKTFPAAGIELITPPGWKWESKGLRFSVTPPEGSAVREADFTITLTDAKGLRRGELYARAPLE